jgi:23S rRNA pseudouridine1911/1915/1917 synthase
MAIRGRSLWEGGLLHRLDYETAGLTLIARTQAAFDALLAAGKASLFVKEYAALSAKAPAEAAPIPSMPPPPFPAERITGAGGGLPFTLPVFIESAFRAYGPGRKAVRPVPYLLDGETGKAPLKKTALDQWRPYSTEVLEVKTENKRNYTLTYTVKILD